MSVPNFLKPNLTPYIDPFGLYGLNRDLLLDNNRVIRTQTTSAASDATTVTVNAGIDNVYSSEFTCDRVIVLNHNLKAGSGVGIILTPYKNAVLQSLANVSKIDTTDAIGQNHTVIKFDPILLDQMAVGFKETTISNEEKKLAEMIITKTDTTITNEMTSYEYRLREKSRDINLGGGRFHRIIRSSESGKSERYEANCQFRYMGKSDIESLRSLYKTHSTFYFQPEPDTRPQDIFLCYMTNPWNVSYSSKDKNAGYTVNIQVKEV